MQPGDKIPMEMIYIPQQIAVSGNELIVIAGERIFKFATSLNKWVQLPLVSDSNIATQEEIKNAQTKQSDILDKVSKLLIPVSTIPGNIPSDCVQQ